MPLTHETAFESLQKAFCPPLDSSLLAALLADVDFTLKPEQLNQALDVLRQTLKELSSQAEVDCALQPNIEELPDTSDLERETATSTSLFTTDRQNSSRTSSNESSDSDEEAFGSPLGFLQAVLPHVPTSRLRKALKDADPEVDMWDLLESILTAESVRELEERGFEGLLSDERAEQEAADAQLAKLLSEQGELPQDTQYKKDEEWAQVKRKKEKAFAPKKNTKPQVVKITLGDVRQGAAPAKNSNKTVDRSAELQSTESSSPDRHMQALSLSSLLARLFPAYPSAFFESFFLSPTYPDNYEACLGILNKICANSTDVVGSGSQFPALGAYEAPVSNADPPPPALSDSTAAPQPKKHPPQQDQAAGVPQTRREKRKNRTRTTTDRGRPPSSSQSSTTGSTSGNGTSLDGDSVGGASDGVPSESTESSESDEQQNRETALLYNLLDILLPEYGLYPGQEDDGGEDLQQQTERNRTLLITEIQLAVHATRGREDDALDVVKLLRCLDEERKERFPELMEAWIKDDRQSNSTSARKGTRKVGVSYAELMASAPSNPRKNSVSECATGLKSPVWAPTVAIPSSSPKPGKRGALQAKHKPSPYQWQAVPLKKVPEKAPCQILPHLPTYTRDVNGIKRRGPGITGPGETDFVSTSSTFNPSQSAAHTSSRPYLSDAQAAEAACRQRLSQNIRRRDELLREAARMWTRGVGGHGIRLAANTKVGRGRGGKGPSVGGEVAWYFAERAREFQEMARKESVNAARAMVLRKRAASGKKDEIDLHGTTVAEASAIVLEVLGEQPTSQARPLKIITGKGSHSVNQQSVLKPALKKRLVEEGWVVGVFDAGLMVRGRR